LTSFAVESRAMRESLFLERQRGAFQQPEGLVKVTKRKPPYGAPGD
jgi:hypothetical protein